jgi:predicted amidohydrolase YtcJ
MTTFQSQPQLNHTTGLRVPRRSGADLIVTRASIWTGDRSQPAAEAVAVIGDRIVAVGGAKEIESWRGPDTQGIDAGGRLLIPGFNDSHVHFIDGGLQLEGIDLKKAATAEEFVRRIADSARSGREGEWILGGGWDEQCWQPPDLPSRGMIDPVTAGRPALLYRSDLHAALANTVALNLAGVTRESTDPPGGAIVKDAGGDPTGILKDSAINIVKRILPPLTPERRRQAAKRALSHAASLGVTSVQHMNPTSDDVNLYMELAEHKELTVRIYAASPMREWVEHGRPGIRRGFGSPMLRIGALKGFADGSLGSTTALFFEPYLDSPGTKGLLADDMRPSAALRDNLLQADGAGMQVCWHAIGDQAVSRMLDLFEEIEKAHGPRDRRFRIEHAQHVRPEDFSRFAALRVVASVQPYHAIDDGAWAGRRVRPETLQTSYAWRSFLDHHIPLALGTDWTVAPLNPMLTLHAATTRATLDGRHPEGWIPEQKITVPEAVSAYTAGSAYAEFQEEVKGSIAPGKLADMVILSADIFSMDPCRIPETRVELTIMGGAVVYESSG